MRRSVSSAPACAQPARAARTIVVRAYPDDAPACSLLVASGKEVRRRASVHGEHFVRILTIGDDAKLFDYARLILNELRAHQVRAEIDDSNDKINGKILRAEQMKVHTMFVIGKRDMEANAVSVRVHGKGNLGAKPRAEAIAELLESIKDRRVN